MSIREDIMKLDGTNEEHRDLVAELAKVKAIHDVTREKFHRKDPKVLATLLEYRRVRNRVKEVGEAFQASLNNK